LSTTSFETSEATLKRLGSLEESGEEDEDEGTAKGAGFADAHPTDTTDRKGSFSQSRLSSLFDGWLRPTSPAPPDLPQRRSITHHPDDRKSVSEPRLVEHHTGSNVTNSDASDDVTEDVSLSDFEDMLV
jgi:hypothetical protein